MSGRARFCVLVLVAALLAGHLGGNATAGAAPPSSTPDLSIAAWASDINDPWDLAFMPDGRALITEKTTGIVHVRHLDGSLTEIAANQSDFRAVGEGGLMGIAVDPDFSQNRRYYTCQNSTSRDVRVIRWRANQALTAATREAVLVDDIPMTSGRHSGCRVRFGYEGYLWITTGDAAVGTAPQSLSSLGGKVLRIDPTTGNGHRRNPFRTTAGADRSKIYSYGHRNPQGIERRPCTDQMWTGEHGPSVNDEINLLARGGNAGWNPVPGYNEGVPMTDFGLPGPQRGARWSSGGSTIALSGIGWLRGADWGGWDGELAGATLKNQQLWIFEFSNANRLTDTDRPGELNGALGRLRVPVLGPDGSLYVASQSNRAVYRVTPVRGVTPGDQDINGDGYDDLVVGGPAEDPNGRSDAGGFNVLYGSSGGLAPGNGTQRKDQRNIRGARPEPGDALGSAVGYGDIDGDGLVDAVLGAPGEGIRGDAGAGAIHVLCGRTTGVDARSSQTFSQAGSVAGRPEVNDRFGAAVAVGDFDGDGLGDVVSGSPSETVAGRSGAGAITVLYGTKDGVTTENSRQWTQAGPVAGAAEAGDRFGASLAVGDYNDDGTDDLAVGAPNERVGGQASSGSVTILFGSPTGLVAEASQQFTQAVTPSDNGAGDRFGAALAAGDFDGDGIDDLAVGAPGESLSGATRAGEVTVLFGTPAGLTSSGAQTRNQDGPIPGASATDDRFGEALSAGDIDGNGFADLVIGSGGENGDRGRVVVLAGTASGLAATGASFSQRGPVPGRAEVGDEMGAALRLADFNGDGFLDLAVGLPGETIKGRQDAGALVVLPGSAAGLTADGSRYITQGSRGVPGKVAAGDRWGSAM